MIIQAIIAGLVGGILGSLLAYQIGWTAGRYSLKHSDALRASRSEQRALEAEKRSSDLQVAAERQVEAAERVITMLSEAREQGTVLEVPVARSSNVCGCSHHKSFHSRSGTGACWKEIDEEFSCDCQCFVAD